jgi:hypothetical protein
MGLGLGPQAKSPHPTQNKEKDKSLETIVSANGMYRLGFFGQENSAKYHLGIWFSYVYDRNVLWVANREKPFPNSSAFLTLNPDGNLVISDGSLL